MPALAQEVATEAAAAAPAAAGSEVYFLSTSAIYALSAALVLGLAAFAGSFGQANAAAKAVEGVARNPEASGKIQSLCLLSLAFIESLSIYALVIALLLINK
ncbi:MAG: ATP synthase F0 subunit C [Candidatus Bruticola sp.]